MLWRCFRFDNVRIPRENLLNSVADVSPDGQYLSAIKDPDQVVHWFSFQIDNVFSFLFHLFHYISVFLPFSLPMSFVWLAIFFLSCRRRYCLELELIITQTISYF